MGIMTEHTLALYVAWYVNLVPFVVPLVVPNFLGAFFVHR